MTLAVHRLAAYFSTSVSRGIPRICCHVVLVSGPSVFIALKAWLQKTLPVACCDDDVGVTMECMLATHAGNVAPSAHLCIRTQDALQAGLMISQICILVRIWTHLQMA
jgi:hypothetical protein